MLEPENLKDWEGQIFLLLPLPHPHVIGIKIPTNWPSSYMSLKSRLGGNPFLWKRFNERESAREGSWQANRCRATIGSLKTQGVLGKLRLKAKGYCPSVSLSHAQTHTLVRPHYPEPNVSPNRGKSKLLMQHLEDFSTMLTGDCFPPCFLREL